MKRPRILTINAESADQRVPDGWNYSRQRDFSGGESLAKLPELVARNQLIRMENCIISPEGEVTECWQMDKALFTNVSGGIVVAPIPGSKLFTVYGASENHVISFTFDPSSPVAYDMAAASGYPGYVARVHASPVTILGISHGTPFLGKNYCCASTDLYSTGVLTATPDAIAFGSVQTLTANQLSVIITNTSAEVMRLTAASFTGTDSAMFGHTAAFPQVLEPAGTYTFDVTYKPSAPGSNSATLNLSNTLGVLQVALTGTAESMISVTPLTHDFGTLQRGTTKQFTFHLENSGTRKASLNSIMATGDDPGYFTSALSLPASIEPGATLDIPATFTPDVIRDYSASFDLITDVGTIAGVSLSGAAATLLTPAPSSAVILGHAYLPASAAFNFHNLSTEDAVTINSIRFANGGLYLSASFGAALPLAIAPGATGTLTVTFIAPNFPWIFNDVVHVSTNWGEFVIPVSGWRV